MYLYFSGVRFAQTAAAVKRSEPEGPSVVTSIPGPKSLALLEQLNAVQVIYRQP